MARLRIRSFVPPLPQRFFEVRDEYRRHGMDLYFDRGAGRYEVCRQRHVLMTCATLIQARRWLDRSVLRTASW